MRATGEARYRAAERRLWHWAGVEPTEQRVLLRHNGLDVRVQETGAGPPVVLMHGASNSGASWAQLVARLPEMRCIAIDRPGCGLSEPVVGGFDDLEHLGEFAESLIVDVLDALDIDVAAVIATSFGGYLTLRGAAAHPDRFGRIVELGWLVGAPVERVPLVMRVAGVPGLGRILASIPPNERVVRSMFRRIGLRQAMDAGRVPQEVIDCYVSLLRDTNTMRNEIEAGPRLIRPLRGFDERLLLTPDVLGSVKAPVYFLWGAEDPFGGADVARSFVPQLPNAELELMPSAGHAVWIDDPDHTAGVIRRFLSA